MKYLSLCVLMTLLACNIKPEKGGEPVSPPEGKQHTGDTDTLLVKIVGAVTGGDPDSCVLVSPKLEPDSSFNKLLAWYICGNLYSNDDNDDQTKIAKLTDRSSFGKMIMLFFDDSAKYDKIGLKDKSRIPEMRENLLFGIRNCCTPQLHPIADELLNHGVFKGAEVLWDRADLKRLPSLAIYMKNADAANFFVCADLAAFFHNVGDMGQRDRWMAKAAGIPGKEKELAALKELMSGGEKFDIVTYKEQIYGGM